MWIGCKWAWVTFCFGVTFCYFQFPGIIFHSLMASAEVNNAATVRYTEGLIMQSSIKLCSHLSQILFLLSFWTKKLASQKKFTKYTNSLLLLGQNWHLYNGLYIQSLTTRWLLFWLTECNQPSCQPTFSPGTQCYYLTFTGLLLSSTRNYKVNVIWLG